ncbi:MAG: hypothetical protein WEG40_15965 [Candidatus Rokuibacteriota bacterium]
MAREPEAIRTAFKHVSEELNAAHKDFLKYLRDALGGHLDDKPFQTMLNGLDLDQESLMEAGEIVGTTHYRFVPDLLWATLLIDIPESQRQGKAEELLHKTSRLSQVVKTIDDVVICYMRDRRLP